MPSPSRRSAAAQTTLQVIETIRLTPGLVRVVLGGEELVDFPDRPETDTYAKLFFPPAGSALRPPYDLAALRDEVAFDELPTVRTYTIRRVDRDRGVMEIDFVVHGDTGVAGPWAANAQPGDELTMSAPGGGFSPDPEVDSILLIGDESAIPAISAALESLHDDAQVTVLLEARSAEHRADLPDSPASVTWIDEDHDAPGARLVDAVTALEWPVGRVQVFAHGERGAMKALRPIFVERGVDRSDLSLSAYWAAGRTEDAFQAEKRLPVGQIFPA
ncbi:siderophore-interacting protein [Microbacterium sp. AG1240]|uniref:siderophore-interacting protein n=1 Tax=Microbacterium sp. AG1240 TaxID=2183992 RepID=UPI000EB13592|nr:siderophore-interacting protein [Microbacterium sp. AG1240]